MADWVGDLANVRNAVEAGAVEDAAARVEALVDQRDEMLRGLDDAELVGAGSTLAAFTLAAEDAQDRASRTPSARSASAASQ